MYRALLTRDEVFEIVTGLQMKKTAISKRTDIDSRQRYNWEDRIDKILHYLNDLTKFDGGIK
jgi:hypothetical protein